MVVSPIFFLLNLQPLSCQTNPRHSKRNPKLSESGGKLSNNFLGFYFLAHFDADTHGNQGKKLICTVYFHCSVKNGGVLKNVIFYTIPFQPIIWIDLQIFGVHYYFFMDL